MKFQTHILPLLLFCLITASSQVRADAQGNTLVISDAWIAEAPPVSRVQAAYMILSNPGSSAIELIEAGSEDFERIEFHRSIHQDGMASMERQSSLKIPAGGELVLQPGGYHLMMFTPARTLRAGDVSAFSFTLGDGTRVELELEVRKSAAMGGHEHHHHHHH